MVRGLACMTSAIVSLVKSCTCSIRRRKSPSVNTPIGRACLVDDGRHGHALAGDFQQRRRQRGVGGHDRHRVAAAHDVAHMGQQPAARARRPDASGQNLLRRSRAHPAARRPAHRPAPASRWCWRSAPDSADRLPCRPATSRCTSASCARLEASLPVIAISLAPMRLMIGTIASSSAASPE